MIDTLNIELDHNYFNYQHVLNTMKEKMDFKVESRFTNGSSITANYRNYKFSLSDKKLKATGSITKLFLGANIESMSFLQLQHAMNEFETIFGFPFDEAIIKRIDIGTNIKVNYPVSLYLDLLTPPKRYKTRLYEAETKYFESSNDKLVFYDKTSELIRSNTPLILNKQDHVLRYEISFAKKLIKNLGFSDQTFKNLSVKSNYNELITKWYSGYQKIPKLTKVLRSQLDYSSLNSFKQSLANEGVRALGGIEKLNIALSRSGTSRSAKHNIRQFLVADNFEVEPFSKILQDELDDKIAAVYNAEYVN